MSDSELISAFGNACLQAGKNNGLCISARAESDWKAMQEWRQRLESRIQELKQQLVQKEIQV